MKTKRTPTQPKVMQLRTAGRHSYFHDNDDRLSFYLPGIKGFENKRADYVNKCVNACEGIDDVSIIPELLATIKNLSKIILGKTAFLDLIPNDEAILNVALQLIDRAGGEK